MYSVTLCVSEVRAMDGARSDALFLKHRDTEAQRGGLWVLGQRLRVLCVSVFPKSAQWMARGLILFFETQRHGGTEREGLGIRSRAPCTLCLRVSKVRAMDGARSDTLF